MLVFFALGNAKVLYFALADAKVPNASSFAFWWNIGFNFLIVALGIAYIESSYCIFLPLLLTVWTGAPNSKMLSKI